MKHPGNYSSKVVMASLLLVFQGGFAADIEVMTQNQYLGADLTPVITATSENEFNTAVIDALKQVAANNTPARIKALAKLIAKRKPDLVGLQEVYAFGCLDPYETGACTDPEIAGAFNDHLVLTLAALNGAYETAAMVVNLNVPGIPFYLNGNSNPAYLTVLDRDVILKHHGVESSVVDYSGVCSKPSADGCNYMYVALVSIPIDGGIPVNIERGYVGVDVTIGGKDYRFVNTHLEVKDPPVPPELQAAQASELINALGATLTERSLVVVGDMNSSPADAWLGTPYSQYLSSGFTDVWTMRPGKVEGLTCCQLEDLSNHKSLLFERVDLILSMEPTEKIKKARVLGDKVSTKTPPHGKGLWASDHGSVAVGIDFY
jgi:endonuclease/exonuclease/phosphatase family metal-dependent hydrolase